MSKAKKVKKNPNKIPVSKADLEHAKSEAVEQAIEQVSLVFFSVLCDKYAWTVEQLSDLWGKVNYLSDSIGNGDITLADLRHSLKEEKQLRFIK
jgi:hypothetical protein